jgi:hypothetical protein
VSRQLEQLELLCFRRCCLRGKTTTRTGRGRLGGTGAWSTAARVMVAAGSVLCVVRALVVVGLRGTGRGRYRSVSLHGYGR